MKTWQSWCRKSFLAGLIMFGVATQASAAPDLVLSNFRLLSTTAHTATVRFTVRNQGTTSSPRIKVGAEARRLLVGQPFYAVSMQNISGGISYDNWYVWTTGRLAAGATAVIRARVTFANSWTGRIGLKVIADSCSGDEFMPTYCRARESNETNNSSAVLSFSL